MIIEAIFKRGLIRYLRGQIRTLEITNSREVNRNDRVLKSRDEWREAAYTHKTASVNAQRRLNESVQLQKDSDAFIHDLIDIVSKKEGEEACLIAAKNLFFKNWIDTVATLEGVTRNLETCTKQRNQWAAQNTNQVGMIKRLQEALDAERAAYNVLRNRLAELDVQCVGTEESLKHMHELAMELQWNYDELEKDATAQLGLLEADLKSVQAELDKADEILNAYAIDGEAAFKAKALVEKIFAEDMSDSSLMRVLRKVRKVLSVV